MGKVKTPEKADTFKAVREMLVEENTAALPSGQLQQYADLFMAYRESSLNIARCGVVVAHPKTGQPIENPYLKVRQSTLTALRGFSRVKANRLWDQLSAEVEAIPTEAAR